MDPDLTDDLTDPESSPTHNVPASEQPDAVPNTVSGDASGDAPSAQPGDTGGATAAPPPPESEPARELDAAPELASDLASDPAPVPAPAPAPAPEPVQAPERMFVLGGVAPAERLPSPEPAETGVPCEECGEGRYDADGYCGNCGAKARDPREHVVHEPASWVAGVCDRGIRHPSNEDALAVAARDELPRRAAIVVCDGVSTAQRSAEASQAAADSALAVLQSARSRGIGGAPSAFAAALGTRLDGAADAAADAVREVTDQLGDAVDDGFHVSNPACTFVAAVIDGDTAVVGSVGDSRAYWVPDVGQARRLTLDDSWAEEQIKLGASRAEAEAGPQGHTITRWIGIDTPDHVPAKTTLTLLEAGWLVLCSDGLWNYCSDEGAFADVVRGANEALADPGATPLLLAEELTAWANSQGGRDNITVALARIDPAQHRSDATSAPEQPDAHATDDLSGAGTDSNSDSDRRGTDG